jgi:hypothetical protein
MKTKPQLQGLGFWKGYWKQVTVIRLLHENSSRRPVFIHMAMRGYFSFGAQDTSNKKKRIVLR